jgi:hypothetical protein
MCSIVSFFVVRRMLGLLSVGLRPDDKDVEIAVLRHQLAILQQTRLFALARATLIVSCCRCWACGVQLQKSVAVGVCCFGWTAADWVNWQAART